MRFFAKVGAYVLGNVLISVITGAATFIWLIAFGVPYPLLLAIFVAVLDLVPIVGSTVAGVVVAAVAPDRVASDLHRNDRVFSSHFGSSRTTCWYRESSAAW